MTNSAVPGGASFSCRGGDAHYGSAADPVAGVSSCVPYFTYAGGYSCTQAGMYTGQSEHSMTVNDGGIMHTSSFCNGLWNRPQASVLRHRIIRRSPMEVALYTRASTPRQQQQQTIAQQLRRLRDYVA